MRVRSMSICRQVNALQRHSLSRELHILDRIRHGAIIRAGAIVEDDGGDNPLPMLYIEVNTYTCTSPNNSILSSYFLIHNRTYCLNMPSLFPID